MTNPQKPQNAAALLATLLSGLSTGAVNVIELEIDSSRSIEDQFDEIAGKVDEKLAAQHREECPACRAEYEAKQAAANRAQKPEPFAADTRKTASDKNLGAPYGSSTGAKYEETPKAAAPKPLFHEIGFMAFNPDGEPIPSSFALTREKVAKALEEFTADPTVKLMSALFGPMAEGITIHPVYDKREA